MNNRQKRTTLRKERIYSAILLEVRTSSLRQVCPFPSAMDFNVVFKDLIFPCRPCSSDYFFRTAWPPFHFRSLTALFSLSLSLSLLGFCFHYSPTLQGAPNLLNYINMQVQQKLDTTDFINLFLYINYNNNIIIFS